MTDDDLRTLATLAVEVAITVPVRLQKHQTTVVVSVDLVNRIRERMTAMGLDWKAKAREVRKL